MEVTLVLCVTDASFTPASREVWHRERGEERGGVDGGL